MRDSTFSLCTGTWHWITGKLITDDTASRLDLSVPGPARVPGRELPGSLEGQGAKEELKITFEAQGN